MKKSKGLLPFYCTVIILAVLGITIGNKTVSTISNSLPIRRNHCIIIDAGHGGEDGGAVSCTGIPESVLNLQIALKLNDIIHLLGYNTRMIRTEDTAVYTSGSTIAQKKISDLKERVRIANENESSSILLSIHQNFYTNKIYSGAQVFYGNGEGSKALSQELQHAILSTINTNSKRKEKSGTGIYLLEKAKCPAVIIECGFLSNEEEEAKLRTEMYQKSIASVIACSAAEYLSKC